MIVPEPVRRAVEEALTGAPGAAGPHRVVRADPVGGGCISPVARLELADGATYFLKWDRPGLPDALLSAEARGLRRLAGAGPVRVPGVVASGDGADGGPAFLLLEWLEPGRATGAMWERLGRELADLHRVRGDGFGEDHDNFIGRLPQANGAAEDWPSFWRARRLEPQLRRALEGGHLDDGDRRRFRNLFDRLPDLLAVGDEEGPSRLHGDLWSGNVHPVADGRAALVDPATYHGHREVDLAMAELFGGFDRPFHEAYAAAWPLTPGYAPVRRAVYQLYYLLVHVNLFGGTYVAGARRALAEAGA